MLLVVLLGTSSLMPIVVVGGHLLGLFSVKIDYLFEGTCLAEFSWDGDMDSGVWYLASVPSFVSATTIARTLYFFELAQRASLLVIALWLTVASLKSLRNSAVAE
jgi:hypothetical protein